MHFQLSRSGKQYQFWCDYCHHWVKGNKRDIDAHNKSQKHQKKKEKEMERLNQNAKKNRAKDGIMPDGKERNPEENPMTESEIALAVFKNPLEERKLNRKKKQAELLEKNEKNKLKEQEAQKNASQALVETEGISMKMAGKLQRSQILPSLKQMGETISAAVWNLVVDNETGYICFQNTFTMEKKFERPLGLKLNPEQQELWENYRDQKWETDTFMRSDQVQTQPGTWQEVPEHEDFYRKNATIKHQKEENVEYCGYVEKAKGIDYYNTDEELLESDASIRSQEDENIYDECENLEEAVNTVLGKKNEDEMGIDSDRIKNERQKLLAENEFDQDFGRSAIPFGMAKKKEREGKDVNLVEEILQGAKKKLKFETVDTNGSQKKEEEITKPKFSFKKKVNNNKKKLTTIGIDDFTDSKMN